MAKKRRHDLKAMAERYARLLISEATNGRIGGQLSPDVVNAGIEFKDRRALLDTVTKLIKQSGSEDDDEDNSGIASLKEMINGTNSRTGGGGGNTPTSPPGAPNGAADPT